MKALARCLIGLLMMIGAALWGTGTGQAASNIQQINTSELQAMMNENSGFHLINVLPKIIHDARHIPGSVNIPLGQIKGGAALPDGLDTPLVF